MQVLFESRHPDAASLRVVAERRVRFVLRRLSHRVPRAAVQLSDVNGPRGGVDKPCQVEPRTEGAAPVVVTSVARNWRAAPDDALARAVRFVLRLRQRLAGARRVRQRQVEYER